MTKDLAQLLKEQAEWVRNRYSDPGRSKNFSQETFDSFEIIPLSEQAAAVIYTKSSGKRALGFFYAMFFKRETEAQKRWHWLSFFPTDSHLLGMAALRELKAKIEVENFPKNFDQSPIFVDQEEDGKKWGTEEKIEFPEEEEKF